MSAPIALVDYGSGNLASVIGAFDSIGHLAVVAQTPSVIESARLVVLPGVGHAAPAIRNLSDTWLRDTLEARREAGGAILGICLGAQLMYGWHAEAQSPGLGWISGNVERLPPHIDRHTGWSRVSPVQMREAGLARGLAHDSTFYFNHSYYLPTGRAPTEVTLDDHPDIAVLVRKDNLTGVQFHPEKSQSAGRQLLRNLLEG